MGIWSEIKYALNSTLGTQDFVPLDRQIESVKDYIGTGGNVKVIRHIQRGKGTMDYKTGSTSISLTGFSDASKMIATVEGYRPNDPVHIAMVDALTVSNITISCGGTGASASAAKACSFSYQVIEFY